MSVSNAALLQQGYVVDVPYPTFVHRQAMPLWLCTVAELQGYKAPNITQPYRYLELGCAMGIHLHLTAAANPEGHFVGVDFNAQQLLVAQEGLAHNKQQNIEFIQASFDQLLSQQLEPFDFIVTHGVWSWVSAEQQQAMFEIITKLLKPKGILYCSYMTHPGATGLSSIQKLMFEMSRNLQGDSGQKAMQSLHFARVLGQQQQGLFAQMPDLNAQLARLAQDQANYVAHDFLSEHWQPQHSADMLRLFGKSGMSYVGGAGILENLDAISLTPEVRKMVQNLPLVTLQETVKDIARHTLQRQDLYIRGAEKLTQTQQQKMYAQLYFVCLPQAPVGQDLTKDEKLGKIYDALPYFAKILSLLAQQPCSTLQLCNHLPTAIRPAQVFEMLAVLMWAGYIHPQRSGVDAIDAAAINAWMQQQQLPWRCMGNLGTALEC